MPDTVHPAGATVVHDEVIPAKGHWAREITAGQSLRIEDIEGQQAIDFICYSSANLAEKFWAAHTAKLAGTIYVTTGHVLYSDLANPMMTIPLTYSGAAVIEKFSCQRSA